MRPFFLIGLLFLVSCGNSTPQAPEDEIINISDPGLPQSIDSYRRPLAKRIQSEIWMATVWSVFLISSSLPNNLAAPVPDLSQKARDVAH